MCLEKHQLYMKTKTISLRQSKPSNASNVMSIHKLKRYLSNKRGSKKIEDDTNSSDAHIQQELEDQGYVVKKDGSGFAGAAIKLILDNLVGPNDIKYILDSDISLVSKNSSEKEERCKFCSSKCNPSSICCSSRELHLYLLENALTKLSFISCCTIGSNSQCENTENSGKKCLKKKCCNPKLKAISFKKGFPIFIKLKKKLENMKKFYPYVYYNAGNIIELWAGNDAFDKMKTHVLDYGGGYSGRLYI